MDFIGTLITVIFVALIIGAALTFGFVLLIWFLALAALISVVALGRALWYRWRFLNAAKNTAPPGVIEGEYRDISKD